MPGDSASTRLLLLSAAVHSSQAESARCRRSHNRTEQVAAGIDLVAQRKHGSSLAALPLRMDDEILLLRMSDMTFGRRPVAGSI